MTTIHVIFNAHIDPVWLWPWQAGLDIALATCRSACDRLDAHPDLVFTQGEAWVYHQIERLDPDLFTRVRKHVEAGRWSIVGGWWIQPDCNLPSGFAFERQIELGKRYFLDRFGVFPNIAYNIDSFGHAASLPALMRRAGQEFYVMMRPQEHEMPLPARLFRWRGHDGGPEVITFRIARGYATREPTVEHLRASLTELPAGIDHTMCFMGLGDHGGGPTESQIAWCREHAHDIEGAELVFSSPERFFEAIADRADSLPLVTGELQHHAVGCYSVHRAVKLGVRKAEHLLRQAEIVQEVHFPDEAEFGEQIDAAWQAVCFHHFHDTLGGTCLPTAYEQVDAQLGLARAAADDILQVGLRRVMRSLPDDPRQRIVLLNASDRPFDGCVEHEPWLEPRGWRPDWRLVDEAGNIVPHQLIEPEAAVRNLTRILFPTTIDAGGMSILFIALRPGSPPLESASVSQADGMISSAAASLDLGARKLTLGDLEGWPLPEPELLPDPTDTWSHGIDRYADGPAETARWDPPIMVDSGPLMASVIQTGCIGRSDLVAEYRVYHAQPFCEVRLRVDWRQRRQILKLTWALPAAATARIDGIPGDHLGRELDGKERPLRDWTWLRLSDGRHAAVVCPHVLALDAAPTRVRFTLLRSPRMAWHDPHAGQTARAVFSDQGPHEFLLRLYGGQEPDPDYLDRQALMMQRPLLSADLTRGMSPA